MIVQLQDSELAAWDEGEGAWAAEASEDLSWQAEAELKEKRRFEREARQLEQMRRKQERDSLKTQNKLHTPHLSAVKLK